VEENMNIKEIISSLLNFSEKARTDISNQAINIAFDLTVNLSVATQCFIVFLLIILPSTGHRLCIICKENSGIKITIIRLIFKLPIYSLITTIVLIVILFIYAIICIKTDYSEHYVIIISSWHNTRYQLLTTSAFSFFIAISIRYFIARRIEPKVNRWLITTIKRGSRDLSITDVTKIDEYLPKITPFNPEIYFNKSMKDNSIFLGINVSNKPIYLDREVFKKCNVDIIGPAGSGKGVQASVVISQCIKYGDATFILAPKADEWAPSVYSSTCVKNNKKFTYIDIRDGRTAQFSPFQGAKDHELNELLSSALSLGRKGEAADFYRNSDRKALRILTKNNPKNFDELINSAPHLLGSELLKQSQGLIDQLEELSNITCIRTNDNDDVFQRTLDEGGCMYIDGSTRSEPTLMLQKMLMVRIIQLVENRVRGGRHVTLFADELKYQLSAPFINATGTVRDKGMTILMAHQSLADLEVSASDINPKAARQTILDNSQLKWIYRAKDIEVATWASQQTGTTIVDKEIRNVDVNEADSEILSNERKISQDERNLYDTNIMQHLPDRCGLCIGVGKAQLAFSYPIIVDKKDFPLLNAKPLKVSNQFDDLLLARGDELL